MLFLNVHSLIESAKMLFQIILADFDASQSISSIENISCSVLHVTESNFVKMSWPDFQNVDWWC